MYTPVDELTKQLNNRKQHVESRLTALEKEQTLLQTEKELLTRQVNLYTEQAEYYHVIGEECRITEKLNGHKPQYSVKLVEPTFNKTYAKKKTQIDIVKDTLIEWNYSPFNMEQLQHAVADLTDEYLTPTQLSNVCQKLQSRHHILKRVDFGVYQQVR